MRYVSPVTARLFSRAGHSEMLGLPPRDVLVPMEADWLRGQQAPARIASSAAEDQAASSASVAATGMVPRNQSQAEVNRPFLASPPPDPEGTSPQAYLEVILVERVSFGFVVVWSDSCTRYPVSEIIIIDE